METISLMHFFLLCLLVLVSGNDLSELFNRYDDSADATRVTRGRLRNKAKENSLPKSFSKIISGEVEKISKCEDQLSTTQCESWRAAHVCDEDPEIMKSFCKKTCRFCDVKPAPAPLPCQLEKFGCCWDGVSFAQGYNQEGCPECLKDSYSNLCLRFSDYCMKKGSNREWIRQKCPATCISLYKSYAEKTFPKDELQDNIVYNAWEICYSGAKGAKRDLESLFDELQSM